MIPTKSIYVIGLVTGLVVASVVVGVYSFTQKNLTAKTALKAQTFPDSSSCSPTYATCPDGYRYPQCTPEGYPINYFIDPCRGHGAECAGQETTIACPDGTQVEVNTCLNPNLDPNTLCATTSSPGPFITPLAPSQPITSPASFQGSFPDKDLAQPAFPAAPTTSQTDIPSYAIPLPINSSQTLRDAGYDIVRCQDGREYQLRTNNYAPADLQGLCTAAEVPQIIRSTGTPAPTTFTPRVVNLSTSPTPSNNSADSLETPSLLTRLRLFFTTTIKSTQDFFTELVDRARN